MTIQNPTKREITLLWTLILLLFLTLLYIRSYNPFNRRFSVADKEISFPYTSVETISFNALLVSCLHPVKGIDKRLGVGCGVSSFILFLLIVGLQKKCPII